MTPFTLILSGVVAMAAAYPSGLLQEIHKQEISEDGMQSEGDDFNDGVITGMALLQEMLQGKLELADSMENARLQEVSNVQAGSSKYITGPTSVRSFSSLFSCPVHAMCSGYS